MHQTCIADSDFALSSERRRKLDLAILEQVDVAPPKRDDRNDLIFALDRNADDRSEPSEPLPIASAG